MNSMSKAPHKKTTPKAAGRSFSLSQAKQPAGDGKPRKVKQPRYQSFSLQKRIKNPNALPGSFRLFRQALGMLGRHWKVFGGIVLVYAFLNIVLAGSLSAVQNYNNAKDQVQSTLGDTSQLGTGVGLFAELLNSGAQGGTGSANGSYALIPLLLASLALIWALRQAYARNAFRIRDTFYRGMYPLIPFVLVLLVVAVQLIPLAAGSFLFSLLTASGLTVTPLESFLAFLLCASLGLLSLYMICSSLFALYIVCLPDMTPFAALRSARELVRYRRWTVMRKVLFLPVALVVLLAIIMFPIFMLASPFAGLIFIFMLAPVVAVAHSYLYSLYRSLL